MRHRRFVLLTLTTLLVLMYTLVPHQWRVKAAHQLMVQRQPDGTFSTLTRSFSRQRHARRSDLRRPAPTIDPYTRPAFARQMQQLRPAILAAAQRHNRRELSNMSDHEFAVVIALLLYNEHFGSLEEQVTPLRALTPLYEDLQVQANASGVMNLSVWPANIRPSVALEILRHHVPIPAPTKIMTVPLEVAGSRIDITQPMSQSMLYAAISQEIAEPEMAVEYLAANLERGLYRAHYEGVPVTWRTLAAWHNQGIVSPRAIRKNPIASSYIHRTSAYLPVARALIDTPTSCRYLRCMERR